MCNILASVTGPPRIFCLCTVVFKLLAKLFLQAVIVYMKTQDQTLLHTHTHTIDLVENTVYTNNLTKTHTHSSTQETHRIMGLTKLTYQKVQSTEHN